MFLQSVFKWIWIKQSENLYLITGRFDIHVLFSVLPYSKTQSMSCIGYSNSNVSAKSRATKEFVYYHME